MKFSSQSAALAIIFGVAATAMGAGVAALGPAPQSLNLEPIPPAHTLATPITQTPPTPRSAPAIPRAVPERATSTQRPERSTVKAPEVFLQLARKDQQQRAESYSPQTLILRNEAVPGTDFYPVLERLRRAVRDRDAAFLRQIADPNINLTFGRPIMLDDLDIKNTEAIVWRKLERALNPGCALDSIPSGSYWACPVTFLAPAKNPEVDAFRDIVVVGTDVAVRETPSLKGKLITRVSNAVLHAQGLTYNPEKLSAAEANAIQDWYDLSTTNEGWQYVSLPDGRKGFISSRYAFSPIGYRAIFNKDDAGNWKMTAFVAGD